MILLLRMPYCDDEVLLKRLRRRTTTLIISLKMQIVQKFQKNILGAGTCLKVPESRIKHAYISRSRNHHSLLITTRTQQDDVQS
jgi:hypothetical protein